MLHKACFAKLAHHQMHRIQNIRLNVQIIIMAQIESRTLIQLQVVCIQTFNEGR